MLSFCFLGFSVGVRAFGHGTESDFFLFLFSPYQISKYSRCDLYNYRLFMRSTHDHEDRVRYWLTDAAGGGQPIPDKVFMVMNRPKSKVNVCFIKLSGIFLQKD